MLQYQTLSTKKSNLNFKGDNIKNIFIFIVTFTLTLQSTIYENAENSKKDNWRIFLKSNNMEKISNIYDNAKKSRVISLIGNQRKSGFMIGDYKGKYAWNNQNEFNLEYSIKYNKPTNVYVLLETTHGMRFLKYTPSKSDLGNIMKNKYIHIALPLSSIDGKWHTFNRDLQKDLQKFQPNNKILKVNAFMVKGNARVDDIKLLNEQKEEEIENVNNKSKPIIMREVTTKISTEQLLSQRD